MEFRSALSTRSELAAACDEIVAALGGGGPADLCVVFASPRYGSMLFQLPALLGDRLGPRRLVGCTGGGVLAGGLEVEGGPGLAVLQARMPGAAITVRHLAEADLPDDDGPPDAWEDRIGVPRGGAAGFVVLADPFTFRTESLLAGLDFAYADAVKTGGLVSGARAPGGHLLFVDGSTHANGALTIGFSGNVRMEALVAQGCRPVGADGTITAARDHTLQKIDDAPATEWLRGQLEAMPEPDRELATTTPLFLGIAGDPFAADTPADGDYLVRNLLGADPAAGTLKVGERLQVGRRVRFHVRDAQTSRDDLDAILTRARARHERPPAGALLFSCLGRGAHLYGEAHHDSRRFAELLGDPPTAGFFCNGEIGPVHATGETHLHGYTSVFAAIWPGATPTSPPADEAAG